jgi:hypothetical protein
MKFPIPDAALESHIAILGKTGSGKTVAAKGMVENVLDAGGRACAIDPTGVWHGLRSSASGKGAGYPVVIFGGPHGDVPLGPNHGEAIAEIIASLATLKTGDAWIWAPEIGVLDRIHFPKNRTFDSSRAPDGDESGIVLAPINLKSVHERLGAIEAEAKANDPRTLKAEIGRLTRLVNEKPKSAAPSEAEITKALDAGAADGFREAVAVLGAHVDDLVRHLRPVLSSSLLAAVESLKAIKPTGATRRYAPEPPRAKSAPAQRQFVPPARSNGHDTLSGAQRRIMASLAFWKSVGHDAPTRPQVAAVAGYSPSSGGFNNLIGSLNTAGHIMIPMQGRVALASDYESLTPDEARQKMRSVLSGAQRKLLDAALAHGSELSRDDLGAKTDYSPTPGGFNNLIGSLSTLGIFVKPAPGYVAVSDWAREVLS